jgi:hypothetical protein
VLKNSNVLFFSPLIGSHLLTFNGFSKLIVLQKTGNCGEFAEAISFLLKDITGVKTRVISIEGIDHAFPEAYLEGKWWIFDKIYTTPDYPVDAYTYASHLESRGEAKYVADLKITGNNKSLLSEHGFRPVNLTVIAILDMTSNLADDKPAADAEVEIFAMENLYDSLVAKGKTDKFGKYTTTLNGGKNYFVVVKKGKYAFGAVGVAEINSNTSNKTVKVHLHKYM